MSSMGPAPLPGQQSSQGTAVAGSGAGTWSKPTSSHEAPPKGIKMPQGPPEPPPDDDDPDKESSVHTSDIRSVLRQHIKKEGDGW